MKWRIAKGYIGALLGTVVSTLLVELLDVVVDSGAEILILTIVPLAIFWGWGVAAIWRRPNTPTALDLAIMRWGCLPFVLLCRFLIYCLQGR